MERISRYALFGEAEGGAEIAPEFVHIEPISSRARLFGWTITPHSHPGIVQLVLLNAGEAMLAGDGSEARLLPGTLVGLPRGSVHAFRFTADAEGWVLSIAVNLLHDPRIAALCRNAEEPGRRPRWSQAGSDAARISWLLEDLAQVLAQDRSGLLPDAVAARLALVLTLSEDLLERGESLMTRRLRPRDRLAESFRDFGERNFRQRLSLASYASELGTTPSTLTRACQSVLGKAPGDWLLDRVVLEAMRSLTYSTATVSQIADDLGFADAAYFARLFKTRTGMTASEFRSERSWLKPRAGQSSSA
jgi:AraC family transcriptional regulator, transcriptional activator of pobA